MNIPAVAQAIASAYTPSGAGRPSTIADAATIQIFLTELQEGLQMQPAAALAGLAPNTVYSWLKRGEDGEIPFNHFLSAYKRAEAESERRVTRNMLKASDDPKFWAAGATLMERKYPDRWGRRSEDSTAPRVIVQIGARDADVRVSIHAGGERDSQALDAPVQAVALDVVPLALPPVAAAPRARVHTALHKGKRGKSA